GARSGNRSHAVGDRRRIVVRTHNSRVKELRVEEAGDLGHQILADNTLSRGGGRTHQLVGQNDDAGHLVHVQADGAERQVRNRLRGGLANPVHGRRSGLDRDANIERDAADALKPAHDGGGAQDLDELALEVRLVHQRTGPIGVGGVARSGLDEVHDLGGLVHPARAALHELHGIRHAATAGGKRHRVAGKSGALLDVRAGSDEARAVLRRRLGRLAGLLRDRRGLGNGQLLHLAQVRQFGVDGLHLVAKLGELLTLGLVLGAAFLDALLGDLVQRAPLRGAGGFQIGDLLTNGLLAHFWFLGVMTRMVCGSRGGLLLLSNTTPRLPVCPESPGAAPSPCPDAGWSNDLIAVMTASELAGIVTSDNSSHSHSLNRRPPPLMRSTAPSLARNPTETADTRPYWSEWIASSTRSFRRPASATLGMRASKGIPFSVGSAKVT